MMNLRAMSGTMVGIAAGQVVPNDCNVHPLTPRCVHNNHVEISTIVVHELAVRILVGHANASASRNVEIMRSSETVELSVRPHVLILTRFATGCVLQVSASVPQDTFVSIKEVLALQKANVRSRVVLRTQIADSA